MSENSDIIRRLLKADRGSSPVNFAGNRYEKINLKFNPFPKSGTANVSATNSQIGKFAPVDDEVHEKVARYVIDTLYSSGPSIDDKFLSAVILGDYGSGKTQLLMYVRYLLLSASSTKEAYKNPFIIYIDNPGVKLSELIGSIVDKIGEENFKKYIWDKIIFAIKSNNNSIETLKRFKPTASLFEDGDVFSEKNTVGYRTFLDNWISVLPTQSLRKTFKKVFDDVAISILYDIFNDNIVAEYFLGIIASDFGVNDFWEDFTSGSSRQLENKYVEIIKAIVSLVKDQGFTDFFILVDEFEDITQGRLSKSQVDNYLHNLRTLIDQQREWCLMFAMTPEAFNKLKRVSPPLADRIASRTIDIPSLNEENVKTIVDSYIELASSSKKTPNIFTDEAIKQILNKSEYITRNFLRHCFELTEKLADSSSSKIIDQSFVSLHLS